MTDTFIFDSPPTNTDEAALLIADEPMQPEPEPAKPRTGAKRGRKPAAAKGNIVLAVKVLRLTAARRELLAKLCGVRGFSDRNDDDVARLVVAASESPLVLRTISQVLEISSTTDQLEAGVLSTELGLDRTALALAWMALGADGPVPSSRPGLALAQAIKAASPSQLADLRALQGALL